MAGSDGWKKETTFIMKKYKKNQEDGIKNSGF